jgi:hypothetical protein
MESIREDMEGGIKTLLEEQGKEEGTCLVTLAQFDTEYELVAEGWECQLELAPPCSSVLAPPPEILRIRSALA